ncbi:MAG: hypothetical protein AB9836_13245 [Aminipila sp.]
MVIKVEETEELKKTLTLKPLVLYGMGTIGMEISHWLDSQQIEYTFVDRNAIEKQKLVNKPVVTPESLKTDYMNANIIVSTNIYFDEIKTKLTEYGFSEIQIIPYTMFIPQNIVWPDLEDNIDWDLMKPSVELFSKWIDKNIKSLVDYGAGQMYLKTFLSKGVKYYPVDYMKRFDDTIVCDLNKGNFPDLQADVSVLNGVLEFLITAEDLIKHVCEKTANIIIISYMTVDKFPNITGRRTSGYLSDLTELKIIELLDDGGFRLVKKESDPLDNTDTIYLFEKK